MLRQSSIFRRAACKKVAERRDGEVQKPPSMISRVPYTGDPSPADTANTIRRGEIKIFAQPAGRSRPFSGRSLVLAEGRPMPEAVSKHSRANEAENCFLYCPFSD